MPLHWFPMKVQPGRNPDAIESGPSHPGVDIGTVKPEGETRNRAFPLSAITISS